MALWSLAVQCGAEAVIDTEQTHHHPSFCWSQKTQSLFLCVGGKCATQSSVQKKTLPFSMLISTWILPVLKNKQITYCSGLPSQGWATSAGWDQLGFPVCSQSMTGLEVCVLFVIALFSFSLSWQRHALTNSCHSCKIHRNKRHTQVTHSLFWKSICNFDKIII